MSSSSASKTLIECKAILDKEKKRTLEEKSADPLERTRLVKSIADALKRQEYSLKTSKKLKKNKRI